MHSGEFVASYTNYQGKIVEKRCNRSDPETIYNITLYWKEIDKSHKQYINYVRGFSSTTFEKSNPNRNKIMNQFLKSKQIRVTWVNELIGKISV